MSRIVRVPTAVAVLLLASFVAGCGGSGSGSPGETTTATTEGNARLTTAQWDEYQTSRAALRKANAAATATLSRCSANAAAQNTAKTQACVGDTFSALASATGDMSKTLTGFKGTVSGPCAEALAGLLNYVGTFQASAVGMQRTIDSATLAGYPAASQNLELALTSGKEQATTFEQACAPA